MTKKCIGCGVTLQNTETQKAGYTPKIEGKYCMRCFRLINYHDYKNVLTNKTKEDIIKTVNKAAMPCFFLLDFLNINLELLLRLILICFLLESIKFRQKLWCKLGAVLVQFGANKG